MIRTTVFPCHLPKSEADALNQESGRVYTRVLVEHYRVYGHVGHWLSAHAASRIEDALGGPTMLHAHSRDAAQQAFYHACQTARSCRGAGLNTRYPHHRKKYRTTIWKNTGLRKQGDVLWLARARGREPIRVALPAPLAALPPGAFREARLVWDQATRHYAWHLVIEDGVRPPGEPPGSGVAAVDLGEVHPAAVTDGHETLIVSARALRASRQYTAKRVAELQRHQAAKVKGSRRWRRLQRRKNRFLAPQRRRQRDMEHKASRAVVDWAVERGVGTLAIGDVRDVADGKRLNPLGQQKVSSWSHGRQRQYISYKAEAVGIAVELVAEAYTSQTCPHCGQRHKPAGRVFQCPACGFVAARDAVGAVNILSRYTTGEVGNIPPPRETKYRRPFVIRRRAKRSPVDTGQVAWAGRPDRKSQEAAGL